MRKNSTETSPYPFTMRVPNLVNHYRKARRLPLLKDDSVTLMFKDAEEAEVFQAMVSSGVLHSTFEAVAYARARGRSWDSIKAELSAMYREAE